MTLFRYDETSGRLFWRWHPNARTRSVVVGEEAGTENGSGYLVVGFDDQTLLVHRIVYKMLHNAEPPEVDHKDGDRANNRDENLRASDTVTNKWNRQANASKELPKGVFENRPGKFRARIMVRGKRIALGTHATIAAAQSAYEAAAAQYFGEFARA